MSISKVNIEEANAHLRKLHKKVFELENKIHMQALHVEELQQANLQLQQQLKKANEGSLEEKGVTVSELTQRLEESEKHVQKLLKAARERDATVLKLEKKARLFYEVVEHRSSIARVLQVLDELSLPDHDEQGKGEGDKSGPEGTGTAGTAGTKVADPSRAGSGVQGPRNGGTGATLKGSSGKPDTQQNSKATLEPN